MRIETIKKRSDFLTATTSGKKFITGTLILQMVKRKPDHPAGTPARIGYTVTKKMGNAVARNRIKRRLRASLLHIPQQLAQEQHDYVIISRHKALDCDFTEIKRDMEFAFSRIIHHKSGSSSNR